VTAAVVGVIANLALWFALHVLFARVTTLEAGPLRLQWPDLMSLDWRAALIAAAAFVAIFRLKWGIIATLAVTGGLGLVLGTLA
jgi:chromate transporter